MEFELRFNRILRNDINKTLSLLSNSIDKVVVDLSIKYAKTKEPVSFSHRNNLKYLNIMIGESFGELFDCAWFEIKGNIPAIHQNKNLYLRLDISGEALLYNNEGIPVKGFTNGSSVFDRNLGEPGKKYFKINDFIDENNNISLIVDGACNDLFGNYQNKCKIIYADIVEKDSEIEELFYDVESCIYLLDVYKKNSQKYKDLFNDLHNVYKLIIYSEESYLRRAKEILKKYFSGKKVNNHVVYAIGHAHLDLAWLWPIRETKRKLLRTLTNVFYLCEKYSDFKFGISQPQLLEWLETESPQLFDKVHYYFKNGQLELQGGAWVEMDTNITGEEAIVRQFLYGMKYYEEKFNFKPNSLWLPDVFGYSGNLPQIIKKSGIDNFMTIKLSWCLKNKFPYHSFNWNGIDGTSVLAHLPPEGNYNSSASAVVVHKTYDEYKEKEISSESLLLFGIGDGGGGPGDEHMERIHRNNKISDLPEVRITSSAEFFNKLEKSKAILPSYSGELYLENHQGTYTSQANSKKYNRFIENKLKSVEYLQVYMNNISMSNKLHKIWKEVLLYQFHDILPGSSIKRVYEESEKRYEEISIELDQIIDTITKRKRVNNLYESKYIFNPNMGETTLLIPNEKKYRKVTIQGLSSNVIIDKYETITEKSLTNNIETNILKVQFDLETGNIISCFDKINETELIISQGNNLGVYKDIGDAWNIDYSYRFQTPKTPKLIEKTFFESVDFYEYHFTYEFKESSIIERVVIHKHQQLIEFFHEVDWQNVGYMLRTSFDLNVSTNQAVSDIQFGNISRSRENKTTVEQAQIEIPAQNWISIFDEEKGVSLLNNAKYGYYIKGNILDINLLRSTNYPCIKGDIGKTSYQYSLFLNSGDLNEVDLKAKEINSYYIGLNENLITNQLFSVNDDNIHYSCLKMADKDSGYALRLYENKGLRRNVKLHFHNNLKQLIETNLIEKPISKIGSGHDFELDFKPFEIKTFVFKN